MQVPSKLTIIIILSCKLVLIIIWSIAVNKKGSKFVTARKMMPNVNLRGVVIKKTTISILYGFIIVRFGAC